MHILRAIPLLVIPTLAWASLLSSVSISEIPGPLNCPAVSQIGASSAQVTQTCPNPGGSLNGSGTSAATASVGNVEGAVSLRYLSSYPAGSAFAQFSVPMLVTSSTAGPLQLYFTMRFDGYAVQHPDSNSSASSTWDFNGATLGTFFAPPTSIPNPNQTLLTWSAPGLVSNGDLFTLSGAVNVRATDYFGEARLMGTLVNITATDASGTPVDVEVQAIPEPGTAAVVLGGGLLLLQAKRRGTITT